MISAAAALNHKRTPLIAVLLGLVTAALGAGVIRDFSGPLLDGGDTDQYAYASYYFATNLSLWPLPHLDLINNQAFYPYGTHHVFLPWGFERDYLYALLNRWPDAEYKPFLQLYYLYSLVIGAVGSFLLLRGRFGNARAIVVGLIVSVFTFYNLFKYPVHLNMAVVHWTVLCMLATYRLTYDLYHNHRVSLVFWLLCAWLHLAVLGLELGYVAGYALAFTTLSLPVIGYQLWRQNKGKKKPDLPQLTRWLKADYNKEKFTALLLLSLLLTTAWAYLPLCWQISVDALSYTFPDNGTMRSWSHPLRLFIPSLPGLDSAAIAYQTYLGDHSFESYAQTSPGLYLTLLAGAGLWQLRRKPGLWAPIVGLLLLCLAYHPVAFPTLKLFPWFAFNRHGGRASMIYPTLLCMLALPLRWPTLKPAQAALPAMLYLMLAEWFYGYRYRLNDPPKPIPAALMAYVKTVRDTPGKAVLDWPFCVQGADAFLNQDGLCPFYEAQNGVNTLRRFYHKASVGQYVGRLHPDLVKPFLRDEWPRLLHPGYRFTPTDWGFLDRFLRTNDFAGITLYPDLLTPEQIQAFTAHYGQPIAQARHPLAGRMLFLMLPLPPTGPIPEKATSRRGLYPAVYALP